MNSIEKTTKVWIWGAGYYSQFVISCISDDCEILGIIDRNFEKIKAIGNYKVVNVERALKSNFDYIVVSVLEDTPIEKEAEKLNIDRNKVIFFWRSENADMVIKDRKQIVLALMHERDVFRARLSSLPYENGMEQSPRIISWEKLIEKIINGKASLSRFGDGEFDIMLNKGHPKFQTNDNLLKERLREIIKSTDNNIAIAIAQNFIGLERFTEEAADEIRLYMENKREDIIKMLSDDVQYYDAYVSRPYILWEDKRGASERFNSIKRIFKDRDLIIVEGKNGLMGVGNDLLNMSRSVRRIICPESDAWGRYDQIYNSVLKHTKSDSELVCISLGPTATVLAFDLAKQGRQALDIGQIDNEYEWYLQGANKRQLIKGKRVAELKQFEVEDALKNDVYRNQIVDSIE